MSNDFDPLSRADEDLDDSLNHLLEADVEEQEEINNIEAEETALSAEAEALAESIKPKADVQKAKKNGHLSKEQYIEKYGSAEGFKDEDQFNKYGDAWSDVKEVITGLQKKLDEEAKKTEALVSYNQRIEDRAYQRAKTEIELKLQEAKNMGDVANVEYLTKEQSKMEFNESQQAYARNEAARSSVERQFLERNKHWVGVNKEMTAKAIAMDAEERANAQRLNLPLTYEKLAEIVEARMRMEYPQEFIKSKPTPGFSASASNANKGTTGGIGDSSERLFNTLSEDHKLIFAATKRSYEKSSKALGQNKVYSKQDFIKQLKKDGEI